MDNQHAKIKGYRDLSQEEIDLMNEIKSHGERTSDIISKLIELRGNNGVLQGEPLRCINIATEYLQTGQMWLVRSVALPESF